MTQSGAKKRTESTKPQSGQQLWHPGASTVAPQPLLKKKKKKFFWSPSSPPFSKASSAIQTLLLTFPLNPHLCSTLVISLHSPPIIFPLFPSLAPLIKEKKFFQPSTSTKPKEVPSLSKRFDEWFITNGGYRKPNHIPSKPFPLS